MSDKTRHTEFVQRYAKLVSNSSIWLLTAQRLYASAKILAAETQRRWIDQDFRKPQDQRLLTDDHFQVSDFIPSYMMLVAFALENLFKAKLVKQQSAQLKQQIAQTGKLPGLLKTHNLKSLARSCNIVIDTQTANSLDRLAKFSVWRGRYHFAQTFQEFYHLTPENTYPSTGIAFASDDVESISRLVERLSDELGFDINRRAAA